jgi:hypothetical protein
MPLDRSHESVINDALATLVREHTGLNAVAETIRSEGRPDVIVRTEEGPITVEVEFEPAVTVVADALSRLGIEIDGQKVQVSFSLIIPESIREVQQQYLEARLLSTNLRWQEWRSDGTSGPKLSGSFSEFTRSLQQATIPSVDLDEAVAILDEGARRAGAQLYRSPGTLARIASVFGAPPGDESANMGALVIINAMTFHERLASIDIRVSPLETTRDHGRISKSLLISSWDIILDIDYWPIFKMAREVVSKLSDIEASEVLSQCASTAGTLLTMGVVGRHDLSGRIFNRLVSDRKFFAAFYTSIPAATLLAGLALSPNKWPGIDWRRIETLSDFRIIDPACGTGTLLMAAYRQIIDNHSSLSGDNSTIGDLHKALVEQIIYGADVVQAAIHVTAATLASMAPAITFKQMNLHTLKMGVDQSGEVWLGSLDWLIAPQLQSFFSTSNEQIGARSGISGALIPRPSVDLVISNPPYTRRGSDSGHEESMARIFSLPEGDSEAQAKISRRTSELLRGTAANQIAGHGSSFAVLADRMVKRGGRIALVLPVTILAGEAWSDIREMLSINYQVEYVISSHDPELRGMSYDTDIAEIMLIARRLNERETAPGRGIFVNLWRGMKTVTDALAFLNSINASRHSTIHRSDGAPVGGTPLIIGGEQWGELLDAPLGNSPWTGARWKRAFITQFTTALHHGELYSRDGTNILARLPLARLDDIVSIGPQHRQIRGSLGVFDAYHGWDRSAQFPAIWRQQESIHKYLIAEPNAHLNPLPNRNYAPIWAQSGTLHFTQDIRYDSQRVAAAITQYQTLGVRAWHTIITQNVNNPAGTKKEIACVLWANSTFGLLLHANHANQAMQGRGTGSKGMLEGLPFLNIHQLESWQLDAAENIWRDFKDREFESFHKCAVDPVRIELDNRVIREMLGLDDKAANTLEYIRLLLASEPSIHGAKKPELPS